LGQLENRFSYDVAYAKNKTIFGLPWIGCVRDLDIALQEAKKQRQSALPLTAYRPVILC